jgi:uncharacterized membrane protein
VLVSVPLSFSIIDTNPSATITQTEDSKNLIWAISGEDNITVTYSIGDGVVPVSAPAPTASDDSILNIIIIILVVVVIGLFFLMYKKGVHKGPSSGAKNVINTLTDNERAVVDTLLKKGGGMRRNELERASGLSKSSLSVALMNLESRKVVEIDRSRNVHYVSLTQWFSSI